MRLVRSLLRAPAFALAAVLALGIGIGASAAFFSVIDGVLLRPLPYRDQEELVVVDARQSGEQTIPSYLQFVDWRARARTFDGMAYAAGEAFLLRRSNATEVIGIAMASPGFFALMGAVPVLGRVPSADEETPAATPVVVLSERLWRGAFGGDSTVVGRTLDTDKGSFTVIGVMPAGFSFPEWASAWAPLAPVAHLVPGVKKRDWRADARAIGRLKRGVTQNTALRELNAIAADLARDYPSTDTEMEAVLTPVLSDVLGDVRRPLLLFGLAVGVVMVIVCANVGILALVRGSARARELGVRSALGASPSRIVRLLLSESAVLSFAGATLGLLIAFWTVDLLRIVAPAGLPRLDQIVLSWRSVAFTMFVAGVAPFIFGLIPAIRAASIGVARFGRPGSYLRFDSRLRSGLLVGQVALSLVLLVCAGLLIRSFAQLRAIDPGFERERLLSARVQPPKSRYQSPEALLSLYERIRAEIARIPGVERVAVVNHEGDAGVRTDVRIPGQSVNPGAEPRALYRLVGAGYFETIGQRLRRGRVFHDTDMASSGRVVVVSAHLAERLWPGDDPIGKYIRVSKQVPGRADYGEPVDTQVVGVVADAIFQSPGGPGLSVIYLPFSVSPTDQASIMVRTRERPTAFVSPIRAAIIGVERDIPTNQIGALMEGTWESLSRRFDLILLIVFAAASLSLAAIGLYGVVAFVVVQRRHEIGVRRAIGATEAQLQRSIVAYGVRLAAVGVAIGIPLAIASGRLLRATLFGVSSFDPRTTAVCALLLIAVAALATYLPARGLSAISPLEALRTE